MLLMLLYIHTRTRYIYKCIPPYLSTSSSTSTSRSATSTLCELRRWSMMRPGVQTTTSGRSRRAASWLLTSFFPPHTSRHVTSVCWASLSSTEYIWLASSLVGVTTSTRMVATSLGRNRSRSRKGRTNAAVLPLPAKQEMSSRRTYRVRIKNVLFYD